MSRVLPRVLSAAGLTSLGVGGIIGTGIFVMVGSVAKEVAGPAILISFLVAAIACGCAALCYAELAARFPEAGSAYAYGRALAPPWVAWLIGWNLLPQYVLAAASIAQGWAHYFQDALMALSGKTLPFSPAALSVLAITALLLRGIAFSARVNHAIVIIKLAIVVLVIGVGAAHFHPANWVPFAPFGWGGLGAVGPPRGVLAGAALVFYAFLGFEALTNYSEEAQTPQKDIPRSILSSLAICTVLYIAMAVVLTGMVRYDQLSKDAPISEAFGQIGLPWIRTLVAVGALVGITSVLLIILMSLPRILLALGRESLSVGGFLATVDPTSGVPRNATLVGGVLVALLAGLVPLEALGAVAVMANLVTFIVVAVLAVRLRRRLAIAPVLTLVMCVILLLSLPWFGWPILGAWLVVGAALYQFRPKAS